MAEGAGLGIRFDSADVAQLFGEDQARYLVAVRPADAAALMQAAAAAGVLIRHAVTFGGAEIRIGHAARPLADLSALYRGAFAKALGL